MKYWLLALVFCTHIAHAREWVFDVYLDKQHIGEHAFNLTEHGEEKTLTSAARFRVKLLFINAYSYSHQAMEKWHGDCLESLNAHTVENDEVSDVSGIRHEHDFALSGPKGTKTLPQCVMTFAYWNPEILKHKHLINPQTGVWQAVDIRQLGDETIRVGDENVAASHYKLTGDQLDIDLWYSPAGEWLSLQSTTPEGYHIRYKLRKTP